MTDETQIPTFAFPGPAESPTDVALPNEIGGFRILSVLGRGGMGIVYEAEQETPHRRVALKVIRAGGQSDELRLRLFRREAETLARLVHPNIAAIYEAGRTEDGQHFFTMELAAGQPLDHYVRDHMGGDAPTPAQLRDRLRLFATICRAVSYAHQRGVIHRDLKPSNILVVAAAPGGSSARGSHPSSSSRQPQIKILDFGLARIVDADSRASQLSELGDIRGTVTYMSPEQARGATHEIDLRSDVYTLGVLLYELITSRFPYETGGSLVAALRAIGEQPPKPLQQTFRGGYRIDPDLQTIAGKALEKGPERRYASADALAEDVERYLANEPILAHPPSSAYLLRKTISRHRVVAGLAAAILVLLAVGAVVMTIQSQRIRRERDRAEQEAARATAINQFLEKTFGAADPWQRGTRGVSLVEALKRAEGEVHAAFAGQPAVEANVLETLARTYTGLGQHKEAEALLRRALVLRGAGKDEKTVAVAATLGLLSRSLWEQSRYAEAAAAAREELAIRLRLQGKDSGPAAEAMNDLASALAGTGDFEEATRLATEALAIRRRVFGPRSDEAAASLRTIANLDVDEETHARTERAVEERLAILRERHGNESPQVALALNDLGISRLDAGDLAGAERFIGEALAINRRLFGEDHPEVASNMENLSYVASKQGRYAESIQTLEQVIVLRRRAFGEDSEPVARSVGNLAIELSRSGDAAKAEPLFREAVEKLTRFLGPDNLDVSEILTAQGRNFQRLGRFAEAEGPLRRSLAIRVASLSADSQDTARTRLILGGVLAGEKKYAEAEELLRLSEQAYRKKEGAAGPNTQKAIHEQVDLYRSWGKTERAEQLAAELTPGKP